MSALEKAERGVQMIWFLIFFDVPFAISSIGAPRGFSEGGNTYVPGGPLVFKGGYHARVQKHGKRVVFHGEASAARPVFNSKNQEKGYVFKAK